MEQAGRRGKGERPRTTITFAPARAKFVRITQTESAADAPAWSIRNLRVYEAPASAGGSDGGRARRDVPAYDFGSASHPEGRIDMRIARIGVFILLLSGVAGRRLRLPDRGRRQRAHRLGAGREGLHAPPTSASMKLLWKVKLDSTPRAMHNLFAPLIAERVTTAQGAARGRPSSPASPTTCSASTSRPASRSGTARSTARWPIQAARQRHALPRRPDRGADDGAGRRRASTRSTPCRGTAGCARSTWPTARTSRRPRSSCRATASRTR